MPAARAFAAAGVPFEVVPGVPAATAVPAYAGIPLGRESGEIRVIQAADASRVTFGPGSLVVLGAEAGPADLGKMLIAAGWPDTTPFAITWDGTTTAQRTVISTLGRITADLKAAGVSLVNAGEAVAVVGDAAAGQPELSWYETKPLFGWRVLVPRTKADAAAVSEQPARAGRHPGRGAHDRGRAAPHAAADGPCGARAGHRALPVGRLHLGQRGPRHPGEVRGVRPRRARVRRGQGGRGRASRPPPRSRTSASRRTWCPDGRAVRPGAGRGLAAVRRRARPDQPGAAAPRRHRDREPGRAADRAGLGGRGRHRVPHGPGRPPPAPIREAIKGGGFDAVLFTSSSTVRNLVGIAGKPHAVTVIAVIGPQTAKTAAEFGLRVDVMAPTPSMAGRWSRRWPSSARTSGRGRAGGRRAAPRQQRQRGPAAPSR